MHSSTLTSVLHVSALIALLVGPSISLSVAAPAAAGVGTHQYRIVSVSPTVLFPKQSDGGLRQLAWLRVASLAERTSAEVAVSVSGAALPVQQVTLATGETRVDLLLPDLTAPAEVNVDVRIKGVAPLRWSGLWQPARKWKIYAIKSSHYDLGYDGRIDVMQREAADYLDIARRLCTDRDQLHEWHYHIEHLRFLRAYERERGPVALASFLERYVKPGIMTLSGNSSGAHFHWMDYEQLARFGYPARRELKDRYGLDITGITVADNPSVSWPAYQLMAQAGFKYLLRLGQTSFRAVKPSGYAKQGMPRVAWMTGPDGHHRILASFHDAYAEPLFLGHAGNYGASEIALAAEKLSDRLRRTEQGVEYGPYPYDALILSNYVDWEIPHEQERVLDEWRKRFTYPEVHLDNAFQALAYIEKNFADKIPVVPGDTNNNSGDYSSIDPRYQGIKRQLTRLLPFTETLHALAAARAPNSLVSSGRAFADHWLELMEFDEHCWPTMLSVNDQNIFNTVVAKHHGIDRVALEVNAAFARASEVLLGATPAAAERLAVWNALAHPRTDLVEYSLPANTPVGSIHAVEESSGRVLPVQREADNRIRFLATTPALGHASYRLVPGEAKSDPTQLRAEARGETIVLANRWYRLEVGAGDGRVRSLRSLLLDRELLDPGSPWGFNDFIRCHTPPFSYGFVSADLNLTKIGRATARLIESGPVAAAVEILTTDEKLDVRVVTHLRLFAEVDHVAVTNQAERMGFLHSARADRYRENVFVAFPLLIPGGRFRAEYGPGTIDPARDFAPASNTDFVMVNRWIDVSNDQFGVTLSPREAAAVHCGKINYNFFRPVFKATSSHLYSYAWSNRMAGLTNLSQDDYQATLSYALRVHPGDWREGQASRFGWSQGAPLIAQAAPVSAPAQSTAAEVSAANVQLTVLKRAEAPGRGYIVRVVETEGRPRTAVSVRVPGLPVTRARRCDVVENDLAELQLKNGILHLELGPYELATVRLEEAAATLPAVGELAASEFSDASLRLTWKTAGAARASGYHIFRSEVAAEPPSAQSLVGYATELSFTDRGLKPGVAYHYRVAAATPNNSQGPLSAPCAVRTTLVNRTPPAALVEVGVVPMAEDRLCCYWQRSAEPDVALYRVHRSRHADFTPGPATLIAEVQPDVYYYQLYFDRNVAPGETWYYRVLPVDFAGNEQSVSRCVSGATPRRTAPWAP
jgi:alpha-mannosidase